MAILNALMLLFLIALAFVCVYALWKGGPDERRAAIVMILAWAASDMASHTDAHWKALEIGVMAVDAATFLAFLGIAHRSRKFWPLWASAAQLVGTMTHLAVMSQGTVIVEVYATAQPFWAFPVMIAVLVGTINEHRARRAKSLMPNFS